MNLIGYKLHYSSEKMRILSVLLVKQLYKSHFVRKHWTRISTQYNRL